MTVLKSLLTAALVLVTQPGSAQEVPEPKMLFVRGGVLCDTQTDLEVLLTEMYLADNQWPAEENIPASCGRFVPRSPMPAMATPLGWYETPSPSVLITKFVFQPSGWEQFGWSGYKPNPDWQPQKGDPA